MIRVSFIFFYLFEFLKLSSKWPQLQRSWDGRYLQWGPYVFSSGDLQVVEFYHAYILTSTNMLLVHSEYMRTLVLHGIADIANHKGCSGWEKMLLGIHKRSWNTFLLEAAPPTYSSSHAYTH